MNCFGRTIARLGTSAVLAASAGLLAGCGGPDTVGQETDSQNITVFAAASLTAPFTELAATFEAENPGTNVVLNFAGSADLVTQLTQGAPADVFASADTTNMNKATDAGLVSVGPTPFATNVLTIVTAPGNPKNVTGFADLSDPDVLTVVCAPQVPCGTATERIEDATGNRIPAVSEESAVTDVLGKVTSGQADAGLVYVTDAAAAEDRLTAVPFPESAEAVNTYPIAVLDGSDNPDAARSFVAAVTGETGRRILADAEFAAP